MPDSRRDLLGYSRYFTKKVPEAWEQLVLLLVLGAVVGAIAVLFTHAALVSPQTLFSLLISGASAGLLVITLPALLTIMLMKGVTRRAMLKHLFFATIISSVVYSIFIVLNALLFYVSKNALPAYLIMLLGNASVYTFWIIINKMVFTANKKRAWVVSALQPLLNVFFYVPLGKYILSLNMPLDIAIIKLLGGMIGSLVIAVLFMYIIDKPMKKALNTSGIKAFSIMVNQWLYNTGTFEETFSSNMGEAKDIPVKIFALRRKKEYKAIFVEPAIHYGPFAGVGGSVFTERMGQHIYGKYNAVPFTLHGTVTAKSNPISSAEVNAMIKEVDKYIDLLDANAFKHSNGFLGEGYEKPCKAINVNINGVSMISLTKAPTVTEDIDEEVGKKLETLASRFSKGVMLIDAHNSRFETSSSDELKGIYPGSKYVEKYEKAIEESCNGYTSGTVRCGVAQVRLHSVLGARKDIGKGFASVCVFDFSKNKKFAMIYFDANNMLPSLREKIIVHVREKFGIDAEVYTTDTHGVNGLSLPASNVLGRSTRAETLLPAVDGMIETALGNIEEVDSHFGIINIRNFRVWGGNAEEKLTKASKYVLRMVKIGTPIIVTAGLIISAWIIYYI
ncbi:MAG: DUF2070 family protein [Candidatus Micrarchaeia archaeon]